MGEVYRARDTTLKRDVALKVLPMEMAADPSGLARFRREAETVAGLNHPNIVTIFSVEEDAEVRFLTMELIDGQSLDRLIAGGGLPLERIIEIGSAVADALTAAHEKGIVHRDLKPGNVMVTENGQVKVLDFGLAKQTNQGAVTDDDETHEMGLTRDGFLIGTVPYMSPEQLRGEELDHRSDLFSLGILLYELATGQRPFRGQSQMDLSMAILRDAPLPLSEIEPGLPAQLETVISRCLEKRPDDRCQTADEVRRDLQGLVPDSRLNFDQTASSGSAPEKASDSRRHFPAIGIAAVVLVVAALSFVLTRVGESPEPPATRPAATVNDRSVAVLPFANMSDDPGNEYFSDGISEELLNLLAKIPELRVISRTSSFSFRDRELEVPEIAARLNVAHILDGSVRKAGDRVRIAVQLIDARSDSQLWSQTYDRTLDDIFAIQDEIAATVVRQLRITLLGGFPKATVTDPNAYALYLEAQYQGIQISADRLEKSIALYQQALSLDPGSAAIWDGLAAAYLIQANNGLRPEDEGYRLAREAAEKAIALDATFGPAHETLGWIAMWHDNDLTAAAQQIEKALALDPTYLGIVRSAATLMEHLGRLDEAIELGEFVIARDPVNPSGHSTLGHSYLYAGRWDQARASYETGLRLGPDDLGAHYHLGLALLFGGRTAEALAVFGKEIDDEWRVKGQALAFFAHGRQEEFAAMLAELTEGWGGEWPSEIAHVYAYAGDADAALNWLERAIAQNEPGLTEQFLLPFFAPIRTDPRWGRFLQRVGSSPEQLNDISFEISVP